MTPNLATRWLATVILALILVLTIQLVRANAGCFDDLGCQGRDPSAVPGTPTPSEPDPPGDPVVGVDVDDDQDHEPDPPCEGDACDPGDSD